MSLFNEDSIVTDAMLMNNWKTYTRNIQFTDWDASDLRRMVQSRMESAIANRLDVMEFAEDENGNPDGVKNYQEMLITIASDIANDISELTFEIAKKELDEELNLRVTKMITEGRTED